MERIAVIGNCCCGKSVLGRALAEHTGLPYFELDRFLLRPQWQVLEAEPFTREHDHLIARESWLIEGLGWRHTIAARFERATRIILIDLPLWLLYARAAERQQVWAAGKLTHPPGGLPQPPSTPSLFQLMWEIDQLWMPEIRALSRKGEAAGKTVTHLTSEADVIAFGRAEIFSVSRSSHA